MELRGGILDVHTMFLGATHLFALTHLQLHQLSAKKGIETHLCQRITEGGMKKRLVNRWRRNRFCEKAPRWSEARNKWEISINIGFAALHLPIYASSYSQNEYKRKPILPHTRSVSTPAARK
jgi:hypothetical protein